MVGKSQSDKVEMWALERLKRHPENETIFEPPKSGETFGTILLSIKENGIWEPLLVKADGTILAGHMRHACATQLGLREVPVRVWDAGTYREEVTLLIRSNTDRRQLTKAEISAAFRRLKEIPQDEGGAQRKRGRPAAGENNVGKNPHITGSGDAAAAGENNVGKNPHISRAADAAAEALGVSRDMAEACETVFTTPGVPEEVKNAVNSGELAPTTTASKIQAEVKRQGGELKSGAPLMAMLKPEEWDRRPDHVKRLQAQVEAFDEDCDQLFKAYQSIDRVLKRRPLASLLGPTEQEEYRRKLQLISDRVWLEMDGAEEKPAATLTVIRGGKE